LGERIDYYDVALISRPHNMAVAQMAFQAVPRFLQQTRLVYDAEALFAPREAFRLALQGTPLSAHDLKRAVENELALANGACALVSVSEQEATEFRRSTKVPVHVIGHCLETKPTPRPFNARCDILFVGLLDHDDAPNTDSVIWFATEVMPKLDLLLGKNYKLRLAGRNASKKIQELGGARIELLGRVEDLRSCYDSARLFIAPTRYAAGLPMKVHGAAAAGLPVVTTTLIATQLRWNHGEEVLIADRPEDFASACHRLYTDASLWERLRRNALACVGKECNPAEFSACMASLFNQFTANSTAQAAKVAISQ
jgi:glycosyltransferase involved in cell wall biosynthesis